MLRDLLQIGDKIDVKHLDHMGAPVKQAKTYVSQLLDFIDVNTISIAMPLINGQIFLLQAGENYRLIFYTAKGLYQCSCNMKEAYRENNAIIAKVQITSDLEKFQRRQFYRLECIHEIEYRTITKEELLLQDSLASKYITSEQRAEVRRRLSHMDQLWNKASITDLSGGGAKFTSEVMHKIGDKIRIKLDFITGGELKKQVLGAEIITSTKLLNRSGKYEHRAEFTEIGKVDREDLIKYIFEQERRRRRNDKV